ncbi:MAG TPA: DUF6659 family protein [Nitrosopumilaceae archaeon]|nr:DUF6659 family protein [Nitrosopumilaceae archaeon]
MDFERLYKEIMNLDPNVRLAIVLNRSGERISGGYRENLKHFLTSDELSMVLYHASQRWEGRKHLAHKIGNALYSMTEYEKVKRMSFPIDENHMVLVSTETSVDHTKIINGVLKLIRNNFPKS